MSNIGSIQQSQSTIPIYANVYHFWSCFNTICSKIGLGVYHTGIEIDGYEYMYYGFDGQQSGVIAIHPFTANYQFQQQILLGHTNYSYYNLKKEVLQPLQSVFIGNRYDLLANNCNHFAYRMAEILKVQQKFPHKVFTITKCCNILRCCIPNCILNGRLDWFDWSQSQQQYQRLQDSTMEPIKK